MLRNYLLTAYKVFMRRKLYTAINLICIVLTLVVLIVTTALLENMLFPSKGVEAKSGRFLQIDMMRTTLTKDGRINQVRVSPLGYKLIEKYLKPLPTPETVAALTKPRSVPVYQDGRLSELQMRRVDTEYWKVLDFTLLAGRLITREDEEQARQVAVLNESSARKLFGSAAAAVGKQFDAAGQTLQVIGVVKDAMHFNAFADVWAPITTHPTSDYRQQIAGDFVALLLARTASDLPQIRAEVKAVAASVEFDDPTLWNQATFWADSKLDAVARMLGGGHAQEDSGAGTILAIIAAGMLLFMLLPALNLVNLNAGRILERSSEIGVRKSFGATSGQVAAQLIIENILLCLAGGLLSLVCAAGVLLGLEQVGVIPYIKVDINFSVLGLGLLLTLVFGLLSGVLPAWRMSRLDPVHALKGAV